MMKSRWFRLGGILPLVGALAGLAGCGADSTSTDALGAPSNEGVASEPLTKAPSTGDQAGEAGKGKGDKGDGFRGHHGGRHGGPEHLLRAALHELDLSDAQKATIKGALDGLHDGAKKHGKDPAMFAALAQGVRAGSIDKTAIEAKLAGAEKGAEEHRARVAEALGTLHATLTKEQRRALIDALAAKMEKRGEKGEHGPMGDRDGKPGRGGPEGRDEHAGKGDHGMKGGPLGHLLRDLDLRDEQRAQIDKALEATRPSDADRDAMKAKHEAMRTEMRARMEAFAGDRFNANAFLPAAKEGPRGHLEGMITSLAAVLPILDQAQRDALADRLEEGPRMGKHERGGKPERAGKRGAESL